MCDFCQKKKTKNWEDSNKEFENDSLANEFDAIIEGNILKCNYDAYSCDSSFYEKIIINFCPICGRNLKIK